MKKLLCEMSNCRYKKSIRYAFTVGALKDDVCENLSQRLFRCCANDMTVLSMRGRANVV